MPESREFRIASKANDCKKPEPITCKEPTVDKNICKDPAPISCNNSRVEKNCPESSPSPSILDRTSRISQKPTLKDCEDLARAYRKDQTNMNDGIKKAQQIKLQTGGLLTKAAAVISSSSATKQLIIGSVSGWTTGFLTMKVGKPAAFAVGGSIILFQIAQHRGLVSMDWDKVKQKVDNTSKKLDTKYGPKKPFWIANVSKFARANTCFAAGFVGGFLIGLAS